MPNTSQSSPLQQQQQQAQQIIATSGVPITFDGQEATFIPAGTHGSLVSSGLTTFIPAGTHGSLVSSGWSGTT